MALADFAAYVSKLSVPDEKILGGGNSLTHPAGTRWASYFDLGTKAFNNSGAITGASALPPTTAATCDRTTNGAIGQRNPASGSLFGWVRSWYMSNNLAGTLMLADRLAHISGLSGTVTTAQTVSTPALTRYTTGDRVIACVEIYTAVGATATTLTISYTNQAGTAGRTSQPIDFGATNNNAAGRMFFVSLQQGDTGVRSVQSVTLAGTTGTAGNFGVTLLRPLLCLPVLNAQDYGMSGLPFRELGMHMPQIQTDACLQLLFNGTGQSIINFATEIDFMEV
ncbi:MAG: hypothetical protein QOI20_3272 [Acidimicrobiaceae bacterium]|jgi:hypothetical protein|nr:hypothetical protein [Acidimicrobiaceae bacterium]